MNDRSTARAATMEEARAQRRGCVERVGRVLLEWSLPRAALALLLLAAWPAQAGLQIQHWETSTGARVYFVESHDLPILDVSVEFPAGSGYDTADRSGLASLTHHLLDLGAGGLTENEIASRLADVGANLGGSFDQDRAGVSLRTLASEREKGAALDIMERVLLKPEFPADVLERERGRLLASIKEADTKPDVIAGRTFAGLMYGKHPYGLRESGELDTLPKLTRDDLQAFYRARYRAGSAVVAIMGDVSRTEAEAIAERLTGGLPAGRADPALPPVADVPAQAQRVEHPASQAHILVGQPGIRRGDPDYYALYVGNYILGGGGFVSRLTNEIREKRGLAYSVYSYFAPMKERGPFQIGLQTKKEQAEQALELVRTTLREFIDRGPTADELSRAKQNIVGGFPLRIDSNKKIHGYLAMIGYYQLPLTYLDDFLAGVEKVTARDVQNAFRRHVNPDGLVTAVVGPAPG